LARIPSLLLFRSIVRFFSCMGKEKYSCLTSTCTQVTWNQKFWKVTWSVQFLWQKK
jgi:hypothetical protein